MLGAILALTALAAARVVALPTLGLRQDAVDLVDQRIAFDLKPHRREAQHQPEGCRQRRQRENGAQHRLHQPRKTHERQRHDAGGDQANGGALEGLGDICHGQSFAD